MLCDLDSDDGAIPVLAKTGRESVPSPRLAVEQVERRRRNSKSGSQLELCSGSIIMTKDFIISLIAALGVGSLVATVIQLYFENRRFKIERKSALNKEIYFKKVEAWEKICAQMTVINTEIVQYISALSGGQVFLAKLNISMDERIKDLSVLEAWFSKDIRDTWNKINDPYNVIHQTYILAREGKMTKEQGDECVKAIAPFNEALALVKEKIRAELDEEKNKIL